MQQFEEVLLQTQQRACQRGKPRIQSGLQGGLLRAYNHYGVMLISTCLPPVPSEPLPATPAASKLWPLQGTACPGSWIAALMSARPAPQGRTSDAAGETLLMD